MRALSGTGASTMVLSLIGAALLLAQSNGEIRLQVKDPSGAVAQASGSLRNLDTKTETPFETDARGFFDFAALPFGRYEIKVSREGFATQTAHVTVSSALPVSENVTLSLSSETASVRVASVAPCPERRFPKTTFQ